MSDDAAEQAFTAAMREATAKMDGRPANEEPQALAIDWSTEPTPASANGIQCLHTQTQFAVLFTDMTLFPGRHAADGEPGHERARVVASLRMDPTTYFQALCVMASNWNRYVEAHVPPQMRQPRFKLLDAGDAHLYGTKPRRDEDD